jgi:uncharacterized protein (DUF2236 family)
MTATAGTDGKGTNRRSSVGVLPRREEAKRYVLPDDAYAFEVGGDARLYLAAGYALLMQVAHPTVGAGVRDHSTFESDPWGRLLRTMDYLYMITLTGEEAVDVGRRVRELHKSIKGANPDGSRYHALEPDAYAWVHATLLEATIRARLRFVVPMSRPQIDRFYAEWMPLGRLLGVRERDMPPSWDEFLDYFRTMIDERLTHNETVDAVIRTLDATAPPPIPVLRGLWPILRIAPARAVKVTTVGLLPPELRERFGLGWGAREEIEFRGMARLSRLATPLLPAELLDIGPRHLRWRAEEIRRGPLGDGGDGTLPDADREPAAA